MSQNTILANEQQALDDYLGALLGEPAPRLRPVETRTAPALDIPLLREIPVAPPAPEPVKEAHVEIKPMPAAATVPAAEAVAAEAPSVIPDWAEKTFQCLLFKVAGLNLAVPLSRLNGVMVWPEEITPMPGHSPHFLGLHQHLQRQVKVVDTAGVVLPPERLTALNAENRHYGHVILIDDGRWGLACDAVGKVITLDKSGVRWRTSRGKRGWLAGTVVDHMCALLDTEQMAETLVKGGFS